MTELEMYELWRTLRLWANYNQLNQTIEKNWLSNSFNSHILVRESGTEPVVRVMVEAPDHDTCQKYVSQVVETIKSRGYGV